MTDATKIDRDDDVVWLLHLTGDVAASPAPLDVRRRAALEALKERLGADACWWAWGQGVPGVSEVTPLAFIPLGYTEAQLALHVAAGLHPGMDSLIRSKVMPFLARSPQHTHRFDALVGDDEWYGSAIYRQFYANSGLDRQLNSVRYVKRDFFSNANFCRKAGRPPFDERDRQLLDWAMAGLKSLHVSPGTPVAASVLSDITSRQRTVLLMVLDGQPRKTIARQLGISIHTVNEHVKQVYQHFDVTSLGELGARFLQSRD